MSKIVIVGSSNTDLVAQTSQAPQGGETVFGTAFAVNHGGKGANQAVAVMRLCGAVNFITKVGNDLFGNQAKQHFQEEGMDVSTVFTDSAASTGVALITVDASAQNRIVVVPGANGKLSVADIDAASEVIAQSDYVLIQLEIPMATVAHAIDVATSLGKRVILNPAPACPLADGLIRKLYLITPNETEASLITGIPVVDDDSACQAASALLERGVQHVIITLGKRGALVYDKEMQQFVDAFPAEAVDTTAAGDVFNGALAVALSEGQALPQAVRFASAASAISVSRAGAQPSVPHRAEVEQFLTQYQS